jgi:hypothetical protein
MGSPLVLDPSIPILRVFVVAGIDLSATPQQNRDT